jgi:hypothetical protein
MGTVSTDDVIVYDENSIAEESSVINGKALFLDNPEVRVNGFLVRCKCGEKPHVISINYGFVDAYCDDHAPLKKRSSYFNWSIFPWNKDE